MSKRDYYEVLGVQRDANDQQIKSAYRKQAMQYHPDRNPGSAEAEERFKEAAEAYAVLCDPQKRAAYDRYGHAGVSGVGRIHGPRSPGSPLLSARACRGRCGRLLGRRRRHRRR